MKIKFFEYQTVHVIYSLPTLREKCPCDVRGQNRITRPADVIIK